MLPDLKLYQLISPSLPVGSFTYSQGLEWAIETGWVIDAGMLFDWLESQLMDSIATLELPILSRVYYALVSDDIDQARQWCDFLVASRETKELRQEERQRGYAFCQLLPHLGIPMEGPVMEMVRQTQVAAFALAAKHWQIPLNSLCHGYSWGWLENAIMTGVKLVPLGQSAGQKTLFTLAEKIPDAVEKARSWPDAFIGSFTPAQVMASCRHESQYTRLFRS